MQRDSDVRDYVPPSLFRNHESELHFLFYFVAALFFNLIYAQQNIKNHFVIFIVLLCFGIGIEFFKELSNKVLNRRIHGNFGPVDVLFNVFGLISSSLVWFAYLVTNTFISRRD